MLRFRDHHIFTTDDLKEIKKHFEQIESNDKVILTTEKDGVRMFKFENELKELPVYIFPIKHKFLFGRKINLNRRLLNL